MLFFVLFLPNPAMKKRSPLIQTKALNLSLIDLYFIVNKIRNSIFADSKKTGTFEQ